MARPFHLSTPHVNVFGTGGDKTINISSIAAIVASRGSVVVKVGTKAVTSHWGSAEFIAAVEMENKQRAFKKGKLLPYFIAPSRFIPLQAIGFDYGEELRIARRQIREEGVLDIYKVVFPSANFTDAVGRVTGYYDVQFYEKLLHIAKTLGHNALLVWSEHGIDEFMPGDVSVTHVCKGESKSWIERVPGNYDEVVECFSEKDELKGHVDAYESMANDRSHQGWETIAYNVASCLYVRNNGIGSFDAYVEEANKLIDQTCKEQTLVNNGSNI